VLRHEGVGNLAVFAEGAGGADLVEAHEPRVTGHVSSHYRRQPASDPAWMRLGHELMMCDGQRQRCRRE
jgi:hypothetical protein